MSGLAIFTFSFSMGLLDFDFTVKFEKQEKKGFAGDGNDTSALGWDFVEVDAASDGVLNADSHAAMIENNTQCQSCDWKTYRSYFDQTLNYEDYY